MDQNSRTVRVLIKAREFIKRGWCKNHLALDADGNEVKPRSNHAVKWCVLGALDAARESNDGAWSALETILGSHRKGSTGYYDVVGFNNAPETKKRDVLRLFDRAISALRD